MLGRHFGAQALVLGTILLAIIFSASAKKNKTVHIVFSNHLVRCSSILLVLIVIRFIGQEKVPYAGSVNHYDIYANAGHWL